MASDKVGANWSILRDAIYGKLTNPQSLDGRPFSICSDGFKANRRKQDFVLHHGIQNVASHHINYAESYVSMKKVQYDERKNSCIITFTDGNLGQLDLNTLTQDIFKCQYPVYDLAIAHKYKKYIALCQDKSLRIMSEDFSLINRIPYSGTLNGLKYNKYTHEIITYGLSSITIWMFRTAGTILVPRKVIRENILINDSIACMDLEKTFSENQRCFVAITTNILVFSLHTGDCLHELKNAHNVEISDLMFYKPLKLVVSGAKDGSIKTWVLTQNDVWQLNCLFIGHTAKVTSLSEFPYGPCIVSSSLDGTVRTWSLDTKDEMKCQTMDYEILGIGREQKDISFFFTFSKAVLQKWKVLNVYSPFSVLGSKAKLLRSSKYSFLPCLSTCVCEDACARIVCPVTGEIVTVLISPDYTAITDVVVIVSEELLFALLMDGRILKVSYKTNPCTIIQTWTKETTEANASITCIALFEYHSGFEKLNKLLEQKEDEEYGKGNREKKKIKPLEEKETRLLIGGLMNGCLVIFNWRNDKNKGCVIFSLQAHCEEITCIAVNTGLNQLASASQDLTLKVWRIYPFASEALAPLFMFKNHLPATNLVFAHRSLGVVYQDTIKSSYVFSMFNTKDPKKAQQIQHDMVDDHCDVITCVDACPKLRIFATSSMDGTVRIWSNRNLLIRVIKTDDFVRSLSFCSQRGDLLVGVGSNLNFIHHKQYLPDSYLYQMVAMVFTENEQVEPIKIKKKNTLTPSDQNRLFRAHCSYIKFMKFLDDVPDSELEQRRLEEEDKQKEFEVLKARDEELELLRDGKLKASHKLRTKKIIKTSKKEAFEKYLDFFYNRGPIEGPNVDEFAGDEMPFLVKMDSSYKPPVHDEGFFGIQATLDDIKKVKSNLRKTREDDVEKRKEAEQSLAKEPKMREKRSLSIAGSTIDEFKKETRNRATLSASTTYVERLKAFKKARDQKDFEFCLDKLESIELEASKEYPSNESATRAANRKIIQRIEQTSNAHAPNNETLPVAPDGYIPNSVVVALYRELRRETKEKPLVAWKPKELTEDQLLQIRKDTLEPVEDSPPLTPIESDESEVEEEPPKKIFEHFTPVRIKEDISTPPPTPPPPKAVEKKKKTPPETQPKPIKKLVSRPKSPEKPQPVFVKKVNFPPPRPDTPLPDFISQFENCAWFQALYADLNPKTFGSSPTVTVFVESLLEKLMLTRDYPTKTNIISAITQLYQQQSFIEQLKQKVRTTLLNELNLPGGRPSSKNSTEELNFIKKALQLLFEIDALSPMVLVELMAQFILAYPFFRKEIMKTLGELGLHDPKGYLEHELSSFDFSLTVASEQKSKCRDMCFDWLSSWTKKFRQHILSLSGKIAKKSSNKSKSKTGAKKNQDKSSKTKDVTYVSKDFVSGAASNASPFDVLNYFCELKYEEEMARLKEEAERQKQIDDKNSLNKNTVLLVPKKDGYISLARIGETHRSRCHPERETSLFYGRALPPIETHTNINSLMLQSKKINLNPFPEDFADQLLYAPQCNCVQSNLITLRYSRKYFIPSQSFVM